MKRRHRALVALSFTFPLLFAVRSYEASSNGISGFSGSPATGGLTCNECHSGGMPPTTTITGPTLVSPGSVNIYTLTIAGASRGGGLDVSAIDGVLGVADPGTHLSSGEIVHSSPRNINIDREVIWTFAWTAPNAPGTYTLYGAGNSVNLGQGSNGDAASTAVLDVTIASSQTPGETSGPSRSPLLVTAFDSLAGTLSLSYGSACETTSNNVYYGPLNQVSSYGWTGEVCDIGTSGAYDGFDPGLGSFFFVIVGTDGLDEGSYGRSSESTERPAHAASVCGQMWTLADTCDSP